MNLWSVVVWSAQFLYCLLAAWAVVKFVDPYVIKFVEWWDKQFIEID
jgi:hypothetical protein